MINFHNFNTLDDEPTRWAIKVRETGSGRCSVINVFASEGEAQIAIVREATKAMKAGWERKYYDFGGKMVFQKPNRNSITLFIEGI